MTKKAIAKKKIRKDCWALDDAFLCWLEPRIVQYKKDASKFIDLSYHKCMLEDKEYTQLELIDRIINDFAKLRTTDSWENAYWEIIDDIVETWRVVMPLMWW